jgi:hypothetical protein
MGSSIFMRESPFTIICVQKLPLGVFMVFMGVVAIVFFIAALIAILVMLRSSLQITSSIQGRGERAKSIRSPYKSVSIVCASGACEAAKAMAEKRLLSSTAPLVPLSGCTASTCACKYAHYDDRRSDSGGRRAPAAVTADPFKHSTRNNRRSDHRRRRSDWGFV